MTLFIKLNRNSKFVFERNFRKEIISKIIITLFSSNKKKEELKKLEEAQSRNNDKRIQEKIGEVVFFTIDINFFNHLKKVLRIQTKHYLKSVNQQ